MPANSVWDLVSRLLEALIWSDFHATSFIYFIKLGREKNLTRCSEGCNLQSAAGGHFERGAGTFSCFTLIKYKLSSVGFLFV